VTAGDMGALEKKRKKNEADRQRCRDVITAACAGDSAAIEKHRKDRKRKAVQRTLSNTDSFHIADIFQRYRQGEDLTAPGRADYEGSDEPLEWKMVVTYSQYMAGRTLAKDEFFFDRFPSAATSATAACSHLYHVRDGLTVVAASASFDYKYHLRLH